MDWATISVVVAVVAAILGILEKLFGWGRKAWEILRGKPASVSSESLPFQTLLREPPSEFKLLPQHYSVELTAALPYVEARFFVVSFVRRSITLTEVRLNLRLFGTTLEAIPLVQYDFQIDPKDAPIITCRRNLTDAERQNVEWRAGRDSGSFELAAKAMDKGKTLTYGPVSSRVIEGWVNLPPPAQIPSRRI